MKPVLDLIENEKTVYICAWCDENKILTKEYTEKGYWTSHGVCEYHKNKMVEEFDKINRKII